MTKNNKIAGVILLAFFGIALYMASSFPTQSAYFPKVMIAIMTALIIAYAIGITTLGFAVSTFLYIVVTGLILYPEKITKKPVIIVVAAALILSVAITVIFKNVLYVPLPSGLLI